MNHKNPGMLGVALSALLLAAGSADAAPFEPQFSIVKVAGNCEVMAPGGESFAPATEGQTCVYGTIIRTGGSSSCILLFSQDNGCLVCQNTRVTIDEEAANKAFKVLIITEGEVEFNLEKGFRKFNRLSVATPSATCEAIACTCATDYRVIGDLNTTSFRCTEGDVEIGGDYFAIAGVGANEQVTVAATPDNSFIRIKIVKGGVILTATDENGGERKLSLVEGDEAIIMIVESATDLSKLDVIYKIVRADRKKPVEPPWQITVVKPGVVEPPPGLDHRTPAVPPIPAKKWSHLTVAPPPIKTCTPCGRF